MPSTVDMCKAAILALKERNGSSRHAIKKYVLATFKKTIGGKLMSSTLSKAAVFVQVRGKFKLTATAKMPVTPAAARGGSAAAALATPASVAASPPGSPTEMESDFVDGKRRRGEAELPFRACKLRPALGARIAVEFSDLVFIGTVVPHSSCTTSRIRMETEATEAKFGVVFDANRDEAVELEVGQHRYRAVARYDGDQTDDEIASPSPTAAPPIQLKLRSSDGDVTVTTTLDRSLGDLLPSGGDHFTLDGARVDSTSTARQHGLDDGDILEVANKPYEQRKPPVADTAPSAKRPRSTAQTELPQAPPPAATFLGTLPVPAINFSTGAPAPHPGRFFASRKAGELAAQRDPTMDLALHAGSVTLSFTPALQGSWSSLIQQLCPAVRVQPRKLSGGKSIDGNERIEYFENKGALQGEPPSRQGSRVILRRLIEAVKKELLAPEEEWALDFLSACQDLISVVGSPFRAPLLRVICKPPAPPAGGVGKVQLHVHIYVHRLLFYLISYSPVSTVLNHLQMPAPLVRPRQPILAGSGCFTSADVADAERFTLDGLLRVQEHTGYEELSPEVSIPLHAQLSKTLKPYQNQTVNWMISQEHMPGGLNSLFWETRQWGGGGGHEYYFVSRFPPS